MKKWNQKKKKRLRIFPTAVLLTAVILAAAFSAAGCQCRSGQSGRAQSGGALTGGEPSAGGQEQQALTPTGYASGEIQFSCVMVNGQLYRFDTNGWDQKIPDGYVEIGQVESEIITEYPGENLQASRVEVGSVIYGQAQSGADTAAGPAAEDGRGASDDVYVQTPGGSIGRFEPWSP